MAQPPLGRDPERPLAPVIFDDGDRIGPPPPTGGSDDAGLFRILAIIVGLGIVIAVLILPPISILDGDDDSDDIQAQASAEFPSLPAGLEALSELYMPEPVEAGGAGFELQVPLKQAVIDAGNLGVYAFEGGEWTRVAAAALSNDGETAFAEVTSLPAVFAVLRRTTLAGELGLIVNAGERPDPAAGDIATTISVMAASLAPDDPSALTLESDAATGSTVGGATMLLGVDGVADAARIEVLIGDDAQREAHVESLVLAAKEQQADGLHLDYRGLSVASREAFTSLVTRLASRLDDEGLSLVVSVPTPAGFDTGAYDWAAIGGVASAIWLHTPSDPVAYYEQVKSAVEAGQAAGVDAAQLRLVLERTSTARASNVVSRITLHEALVRASQVVRRSTGGVAPGDPVTVVASQLTADLGNTGIRWDEMAQAVAYSGGEGTVWLENRFSAAYRLDLAGRLGLGGVVVADARADEELADLWDTVLGWVESGAVTLERPYGPYLTPCWEASGGALEGTGACWDGSRNSGLVTWRAPATPGVYDVTLIVSEGTRFVGQRLSMRVSVDGEVAEPTPEGTSSPVVSDPAGTPEPTVEPTAEPTSEPTVEPTSEATPEPTPEPTSTPPPSGTPDGPPGPAGNE